MKKRIICFSLLLSFIFLVTLFSTNTISNTKAKAQSLVPVPQSIIVVGHGEVEVKADTIQINFGVKTTSDDLLSGQTKMKENIDNITSKLKEIDKDVSVNISYSSSYPVNYNGLLTYEIDCCLIAKSSNIDKASDLSQAIASSNITSIYNTNYILKNKDEAYIQALVKAKENADSKVNAMYKNSTLKNIKEDNYYCCEISRGDSIKICAKIKAFYEIGDRLSQDPTTVTNAFETDKNKTSVSLNTSTASEKKDENFNDKTSSISLNQDIKNNQNKTEKTDKNSAESLTKLNDKDNNSLSKTSQESIDKNTNKEVIKNDEITKESSTKNIEENKIENQKNNNENILVTNEDKSQNYVNAPKGSVVDANGNITKIDDKNEENIIEKSSYNYQQNKSENNKNLLQEYNENLDKKSA